MDKPLWMWAAFFGIVATLLILDLGILHRKERDISVSESLKLSAGYILVSVCFGLLVNHYLGGRAGKQFFTGYVVEKSLSMDNILVMSMVFSHFYIPRRYQHRVLFWGILGVVLLRGIMIGVGAALVERFHFILYFFGAFLIVTGLRMLLAAGHEEEKSLEENKLLGWLRKRIPVTQSLHGKQFFAYEPESGDGGKVMRKATPLFLVLVFIELADIVFAVDSVPAVFAITTDTFVVYTSNIFAILGLRALYFSLSAMLHRFAYLKYALSLVLVFIGAKIFLAPVINISSGVSLAITLWLLTAGVAVSLYKTREK
jgi:tellurite resistance protein TerC